MTKKARQESNQLEQAKRIAKKALTLTYVVLRADALAEAFVREHAMLRHEIVSAGSEKDHWTSRLENTASSRCYAYFMILLAVLYSVVEKWRQWRFEDPAVDALLADADKVKRLSKYRHALFHADHYDHKDIRSLLRDDELKQWTAELGSALRDYFRRWHQTPMEHITPHMLKMP
jgi:hypothetical protein